MNKEKGLLFFLEFVLQFSVSSDRKKVKESIILSQALFFVKLSQSQSFI